MSNTLAVQNDTDLIHFDVEKVELIKRLIAPTATDDELALFLHQCSRTGLDPLAKQIYFQKYWLRDGTWQMAIITAIDGYRLVADRTGRYAGNSEPVFGESMKQGNITVPSKATVTVQKLVAGQARDFTATAHWNEYYPGDHKGHMWRKMPCVMLAKVAEAAALRKAFPADLSGVYTADEMQQAGWSEPIEVKGELAYSQIVEGELSDAQAGDWESGPDNTDGFRVEDEPPPSDNSQNKPATVAKPKPDPKPAPKAAATTNGVDWREKVSAGRNMTLRTVCSIAANGIPYYEAEAHAFNALGEYPFPDGMEHDRNQRVPNDKALDIYDWLAERASKKADQEAS